MTNVKMETPPLTSYLEYDISQPGATGELEARGGQQCFLEDGDWETTRRWAGLLGGPDRLLAGWAKPGGSWQD